MRPIENCVALSQTSFFRNYYLLILAVLMRHTRTSAILFLQQQKYQYLTVLGITTDRAKKSSVSTYIRFLKQDGVRQLAQLHPPFSVDKTRKDRWSEAAISIDFTHARRLAWNTINNLTGRTKHQHRSRPTLASPIAGVYKTKNRESA